MKPTRSALHPLRLDVLLAVRPQNLHRVAVTATRRAPRRSGARISVDPISIAFAPAASAARALRRGCDRRLRDESSGACAVAAARACARLSISKVERSRAFTPIVGASSATARSSSSKLVRLDERSRPSALSVAHQLCTVRVVRVTEQEKNRMGQRALPSAGRPLLRKSPWRGAGARSAVTRGAQIVPGAGETLVDQDRHRACAGALVGERTSNVAIGPQVAGPTATRRLKLAIAPSPARPVRRRTSYVLLREGISWSRRSLPVPESIAGGATSRPSRRSAAWPGRDRSRRVEDGGAMAGAAATAEYLSPGPPR